MSARRFDAVIFDLDGTLVDTLSDIANALNHVLTVRGWPELSRTRYTEIIGEGARDLVLRALPLDARHTVDEVLAAYRVRYDAHLLDTSRPYPGIVDCVSALKQSGHALGVLSNKPHAPSQSLVRALFPAESFLEIWGQRPEFPRKPDPASALALCEALGVAPARCAFVGDTRVDMQTAKSAGMFAVGVTWGFRARAELVEHGADRIVDHAREIIPALSI